MANESNKPRPAEKPAENEVEKTEEKVPRLNHKYQNTSSTKVDLSNGEKSITINAGESGSVPTELLYLANALPSLVQ